MTSTTRHSGKGNMEEICLQKYGDNKKIIVVNSFAWLYGRSWASLVAQRVKNLPGMQETWIQSLGQEDLLKKGMATHPSILAWRILWTEDPSRLQSMGLQQVGHDWATNTDILTHGRSMLSFVRSHQTVFQRSCTILRSHQQWVGAPVAPHLQKHLLLSVFWILVILIGV